MAAVAGIVAGGLCHLLMAGLGVAAILRWWPARFQLTLAGGAAYIAWMGVGFRRSSGIALPGPAQALSSPGQAFRRAMVTNLVNPKAYSFMFGALALAAAGASGWFALNPPGASTLLARATGVLLLGVAALTAAQAFTHVPI